MTPILILGAGRMGGAMIEGWMSAGTFSPSHVMLCDPNPGEAALAAAKAGVRINPSDAERATARTVVLAVKPQVWREAAVEHGPHLSKEAALVSICAGVPIDSLIEVFHRPAARVMPTTAVAILKGSLRFSLPPRRPAKPPMGLFEPLGQVVDVDDEALIDAATAVSGSAPAYFYAFVEALEAAGRALGLSASSAEVLAPQTLIGAAALMAKSGADPAELRKQVTSKAGTTEAALKVLQGERGLDALLRDAVFAALARARELAG